MAERPGGWRRRVPWLFVDQGLYTLSNVLATVYAARTLPTGRFGTFSLIYAVFLVAVLVTRSYWSERTGVETSSLGAAERQRAFLHALARSLVCTIVLAGAAVAALEATGTTDLGPLAALGVVGALAAVTGQDLARQAFFYVRRAHAAVVIDTVWLVAMAALPLAGLATEISIVLAWSAGALVALVVAVGILRSGASSRPVAPPAWYDRFGAYLGGEAAIVALGSYGPVLFLGAVSLGSAAGFRGAQVLYGPVTVLVEGARSHTMAERNQPGFARFSRATVALGVGVPLAIAAMTAALFVVVGSRGEVILGDSAEGAARFIPLVGAAVVMRALIIVPQTALKGERRGAQLLTFRVVGAVVGLVLAGIGVALSSSGTVAASALVYPTIVAVCIWAAALADRRSPPRPGARSGDPAPSVA